MADSNRLLSHTLLGDNPDRIWVFLHGILGTKANWRSIARQLVKRQPSMGALLVDLRNHGESLGLPSPHTVEAAAEDVRRLCESVGRPIAGLLGHSFGGKVALALTKASHSKELSRTARLEAEALWIIDSQPGLATSTTTEAVLERLLALPPQFASRNDFIDRLVALFESKPVAQWLAMNLVEHAPDNFSFGPDLPAVQDLLNSYRTTDLWSVVEDEAREIPVSFVAGGNSAVLSSVDQTRIANAPGCSVHVVEGAGHSVHMDKPKALLNLLLANVP